MICVECGTEVAEESSVCPACGLLFAELTEGAAKVESSDPDAADWQASGLMAQVASTANAVNSAEPAAEPLPEDLPDIAADTAASDPATQDQLEPALEDLPDTAADTIASDPVTQEQLEPTIAEPIVEVETEMTTGLEARNPDVYQKIAEQEQKLQEMVREITQIVQQQHQEALQRSQDLALGLVNEITAATSSLKEANSAALAEISNSIKQMGAPGSAPQASSPAPSDSSDVATYLCVALALLGLMNFGFLVYAIKLIQG